MRCSCCFFGSITYTVRKKASDNFGRILIIEVLIDDFEFILVKLYNANTEIDQLTTFSIYHGDIILLYLHDLTKYKPMTKVLLTLSKVTFLAQVLVIPNQITDALQQIQKYFYGIHLSQK